MQIEGTRALVTGGARGMGFHFVQRLKELGARPFFCDVSGVAEAAAALDVPGVVADVSKEADVERMFDTATEALGGAPTLLINNAGILRDGLLLKQDKDTGELRTLSTSHWQQVLDVNLTGPFLCARTFAARLVATGEKPAVIVNMSSISRAGNMGQSNYSATKAALAADTVVWAKELARYGIRVGAVAPGFVRTPMVESMRPDALAKVVAPVPLRRLGEPEEVWQAIRFVVECDYFTGRVVEVDGGLVL